MGTSSPNGLRKAAGLPRPDWKGHRKLLISCIAMALTLWYLPITFLRTEPSNGSTYQPPIVELSALEDWPTAVHECKPLNLSMPAQSKAIEAWQDNQKHSDVAIQLKTAKVRRPFTMALPEKGRTVVSDMILDTGSFAPEETLIWYNMLEERCKQPLPDGRPPLVVDVGVNVGYFSFIALSLGCRVVGFEPQSFLGPYLATTLSMEPGWIDRFTVYPCGAGARPMSMAASANTDYGLSYLRPSRTGSTPVVRLDEYVKEDVLLLKVDTEGFEHHVLAGTEGLLGGQQQVENVLVEVKLANRDHVAQYFRDKGYGECRNYWERYWQTSSYSDEEVRRVDFDRLPECKPRQGQRRGRKDESEDFWYRREPMGSSRTHSSNRVADGRPVAGAAEAERPAAAADSGREKAALLGKTRVEGSHAPAEAAGQQVAGLAAAAR